MHLQPAPVTHSVHVAGSYARKSSVLPVTYTLIRGAQRHTQAGVRAGGGEGSAVGNVNEHLSRCDRKKPLQRRQLIKQDKITHPSTYSTIRPPSHLHIHPLTYSPTHTHPHSPTHSLTCHDTPTRYAAAGLTALSDSILCMAM